MKQHMIEFLKRGLMAAFGGPLIMAIVYAILGAQGIITSLTPGEVCKGILTSGFMAFIAAGISVIYQIERLPLFYASLIHGVVLYADYILIYLVNGWLKSQLVPILVFTGIFIAGYAVIWVIINLTVRSTVENLNGKLSK